MTKQGIGIFGGSFDPVHSGHKKLAEFMCNKLSLQKMLIIPAGLSPFKSSSGASSEDRLRMCSVAFCEDIYEVSDIEIKRQGKSYTIDTVEEIKRLYPHKKLYLITGSDQLLSFNKWYRYKDILKNVTLCAVARDDSTCVSMLREFAEENIMPFGECLIFTFEPFVVSSTHIRRLISEGKSTGDILPEGVEDYIVSRGLYRNG